MTHTPLSVSDALYVILATLVAAGLLSLLM